MMNQSETLNDSQIIFIALFSAGAQRCGTIYQPINLYNYGEPKRSPGAKPAYFDFSSSNLTLEDHILSAAGDALISHLPTICPSPAPAKTFLLSPVDLLAEHRTLVPP
jgi:hypothetical protein